MTGREAGAESRAGPTPAAPQIRVIELGAGWFAEKPGGLERVFFGLFEHFAAFGVRARGLVVGSAAVAASSGGLVQSFAPPDAPLAARWRGARASLRALLREEPADLVAAHFALYTFPVLDLVRRYPLVVHFHGPWALESEVEASPRAAVALKKRLESAVYRRAACFIVLSQAFKTVLCDLYGVPEGRVYVVPGGVDTAAYDTDLSMNEARMVLGWPLERPILLAVRRLVKRQGLENLIAAVAELRRDHPDVLLYIAGQGPLKGDLEAQVRQLGLADHVRLLGFVPDGLLATTYRAATLSVVPTVAHEGFGLITVESLAAGTPVLVTPVGGLPEVVRDLSPHLVLAGSSVGDLTAGVGAALSGTLPLPTAAACQRYAQQFYDYRNVAAGVRQVYETVLSG